MARYNFTLDGDYVNITGVANSHNRLHKTSRCIEWRYDETGDLIFSIDDSEYHVKDISDVIINGHTLSQPSEFETYIKTIFTGYASGSSFDSSGFTMVTSDGTSANITLTKDGNGNLQLTITEI